MNPTSPMLQVLRKELLEMFRDKRVRSAAFLGPIVLIVALMWIFGTVFTAIGRPQSQRVHVVQPDHPISKMMEAAEMQVIPVGSVEQGRKLVEEGEARLVLVFPTNAAVGDQQIIEAIYDDRQQLARITLGVVTTIVERLNKESLNQLLAANGIPSAAAEPIVLKRTEIQVGGQGTGQFLIGMLPYLIVIWAFYGGMSSASELVAGEKERSTLETLLIAPVSRTQIVLGKTIALSVVCLLSSLSSLVGLALVVVLRLPGSQMMLEDGTGIGFVQVAVIVGVLIPAVLLFASALLAISSYAKNPREAQTHLTLLSFVVIFPAIFSQFIGFTDAAQAMWVNFVPVLNTANNIRMALMGQVDATSVAITIALSLMLAAASLWIAVQLFNREEVLTRV